MGKRILKIRTECAALLKGKPLPDHGELLYDEKGHPSDLLQCARLSSFNSANDWAEEVPYPDGGHCLFHRHRLGQIPWLINVAAAADGNVIRQ
jgi:hypothetical protein